MYVSDHLTVEGSWAAYRLTSGASFPPLLILVGLSVGLWSGGVSWEAWRAMHLGVGVGLGV